MALFPTDAKDGEIFAADNGKNYVYQGEKNVWQSTDCVPKWADQVYIRGVENTTQQNVNDTNQEVNVKVGNVATATNQLLDVAFDVRCRGVWIYQGGAVAPDDPPVALQRFLMSDADGNKTQEYCEAASLTIHAMGAGQLDKISIGETEIGDLITIQNSSDLGGGSYIVTAIEEFHGDKPDELTETYAVYTVTADTKRCSGSVAAEEKAVIRIIPQQAVPAFEDSEYLKTNVANDVDGSFRIKANNNTLISAAGDELGLFHVKEPTDRTHAATKGYSDDKFLHKSGGTMTGPLYCKRPETGGAYVFSCEAQGLPENNRVAFRVTGDGAVKLGHNTQQPFMATAANDAVSKEYLDNRLGEVGFKPCVFTCQTDQNIGTLEPGKFFINNSGSIVLHHAMADGTLWCIKREGRNFVQEVSGIVTISELGGRTMFQGTMSKLTTYGTPNNATHCTLETSAHDKKTCLDGHQYIITIPGILPRFIQA